MGGEFRSLFFAFLQIIRSTLTTDSRSRLCANLPIDIESTSYSLNVEDLEEIVYGKKIRNGLSRQKVID